MSKKIRQVGRVLIVLLPLLGISVLLLLPSPEATGAPYTSPFWVNLSPSPECACLDCPCDGAPEWVDDVSVRTGELSVRLQLLDFPGLVESNTYSVAHRSMNSGATQMGARTVPSWEPTLNQVGPNTIDIRYTSGLIETFTFNGTAWVAGGCT